VRTYSIKPKADRDLDDHADYLAEEASIAVALRFLAAARETFALLSTQPEMGWPALLKHRSLESLRVFRVVGFERMLILYRPLPDEVEILRVVHGSRHLQALFRRREETE
jgi:toxin ParE1/3/4